MTTTRCLTPATPSAGLADPALHATITVPDPSSPGGAVAVNERLSHLFRASLRNGRIHPLYLPMLKYRLAQQVSK